MQYVPIILFGRLARTSLACLVLLLLSGCLSRQINPDSRLSPGSLTRTQEIDLAERAFLQVVQKNGGLFIDPELSAYLNATAKLMELQSLQPRNRIKVRVVNDSAVDLFVLPRGYIVLTRRLMLNLTTESELVAILAHGMGHLELNHVQQRIESDSFDDDLTRLLEKPYSDVQEAEANRYGIVLLKKAGFGAVDTSRLERYSQNNNAPGRQPSILLDKHPSPAGFLSKNQTYLDREPVANGVQERYEFERAFEKLLLTFQGYKTYDTARKIEKSDPAEAISLYHQALLEAPDEPLIMTGLGLAYLRSEDHVPAQRYLIKAINRQPDYYQSRLALGYIYLQKKQYGKALKQLMLGFEMLPTLEGRFLLAEAYEKNEDIDAARDLYRSVVDADATSTLGRNAAQRLKIIGR